MKKNLWGIVLVLSTVILISIILFPRSKEITLSNTNDMLQEVKKRQNINRELKAINTVMAGDKLLLLCMSGDTPQEYNYYFTQFNIVEENKYVYDKEELMLKYGFNIYGGIWNEHLIVMCNNSEAVKYKVVRDGDVKWGDIDTVPAMYNFDAGNISITFYDNKGNEIR